MTMQRLANDQLVREEQHNSYQAPREQKARRQYITVHIGERGLSTVELSIIRRPVEEYPHAVPEERHFEPESCPREHE
jgi:hypothetical protein